MARFIMKAEQKQKEFIRLVANGLPQAKAYLHINPNASANTAKEAGSRWAKRFNREIQEQKDIVKKAIESSSEIKDAVANIVTQIEADEIAFRILKQGETVEEIMVIGGKAQVVRRKPTQAEIQRAYQLYTIRFGTNAVTKIQNTIIQEQPLFPDTK